jgi:antirestriction protein ArdC
MQELYQSVTDRIVAALEQGTPPWIRPPWSTIPDALPMNAQTRRPYCGVNFTLLSLEAASHGYPVNRWLTYRQALELGGYVRKSEQGTPVVFWQLRKVGAVAEVFSQEEDAPNLPEKVYPLLRGYTVFNVAQTEGLPAEYVQVSAPTWEPESRAEDLLLMSGATIRHGGSRAYYLPGGDEIHLPPPAAFVTASGYYNVALHEVTHWTAHPSRCHRDLSGRFGDEADLLPNV